MKKNIPKVQKKQYLLSTFNVKFAKGWMKPLMGLEFHLEEIIITPCLIQKCLRLEYGKISENIEKL